MSKWALRLALALVSVGVIALAGEAYLRLFAQVRYRRPSNTSALASTEWANLVHVRATKPGLTYELAPRVDRVAREMSIRTNSLGMRDDEPLPKTTPGLVRIAAIGDSMTFGFGVQQGDDYPAQLERKLNGGTQSGSRQFDVLNFGVGGYSTLDELATLREKAFPLEPDAVVLAYCLNDPEVAPLEPLAAHFHAVEWWQHSELLRWIASRKRGYAIKTYGAGSYWRALHNPDGPFWPEVAAGLDELRDLCRDRRIPVLVALLPMLTLIPFDEPIGDYRFADLHTFVAREMTARGFEVIDMAPLMLSSTPREVTVSEDDPHFNARGNAIIADALATRLLPILAGR